MTGFSSDWLDLREAADHRARDPLLLRSASQYAGQIDGALIVDLGTGTGSGVRALQPFLPGDAKWRLIDGDAELLDAAKVRVGQFDAEYSLVDLAGAPLPLTGARLVTSSALLDLVSKTWIERLVADVVREGCAFYAPLNFDGNMSFDPEHPGDRLVCAAFNAHQNIDKGFGPALGSTASSYAATRFRAAGYCVYVGESPWILSGADCELVQELIRGISKAVAETDLVSAPRLVAWTDFRIAAALKGSCRIGHQDVLALPA